MTSSGDNEGFPGDGHDVRLAGSLTCSAPARKMRDVEPPHEPDVRATYRAASLGGLRTILPVALTAIIIVWCCQALHDTVAAPADRLIRRQLASTETGNWIAVHWLTIDPALVARRAAVLPSDRVAEQRRLELLRGELDRRLPPGMGLLVSLALIFLVGFAVSGRAGRACFELFERAIVRVPVVGAVYPSARRLVSFVAGQTPSRPLVAVEWPRRGHWALGFVSGRGPRELEERVGRRLVQVVIAYAPAPLSGYVTIQPEEEALRLDMSLDEAIRWQLSAGLLVPARKRSLASVQGRGPSPERPAAARWEGKGRETL